jgi:hypothetical protein
MRVKARMALLPVKAVMLPRVPLAASAPLAIELCEVEMLQLQGFSKVGSGG